MDMWVWVKMKPPRKPGDIVFGSMYQGSQNGYLFLTHSVVMSSHFSPVAWRWAGNPTYPLSQGFKSIQTANPNHQLGSHLPREKGKPPAQRRILEGPRVRVIDWTANALPPVIRLAFGLVLQNLRLDLHPDMGGAGEW